ncbi:hypothetical protein [Cryobacterium sp. MLB-32]
MARFDVIGSGCLEAAIESRAKHPMAQRGQIVIRPMCPIR